MAVGEARQGSFPQTVRRAISRMVLELRGALEEDYRRQLTALGVRETGLLPLPSGRSLSDADRRVLETAAAVIEREVQGGVRRAEALDAFVRESAFTFLNRVV